MLTRDHIAAILQNADIEGFIKLGAPRDEYDSEAKEISTALTKIPKNQLTKENIIAILALVWAKSFSLSGQETEQRLSAFQNIAAQILSDQQWTEDKTT